MSFSLKEDTTKELMYEALGISQERCEEITKIVKTAWWESDTITGSMKKVCEQCNTLEELVMGMYSMGQLECGLRLMKRCKT
jgi:hypothetical protein